MNEPTTIEARLRAALIEATAIATQELFRLENTRPNSDAATIEKHRDAIARWTKLLVTESIDTCPKCGGDARGTPCAYPSDCGHPARTYIQERNAALIARVSEGAKLEAQLVSIFHEDEVPVYAQGAPTHELQDVVTAEHCTWLVATIVRQRDALTKIAALWQLRAGFDDASTLADITKIAVDACQPVGAVDLPPRPERAVTPEMVDRFLAWPLPKTFSPDCGISFDGREPDAWNTNKGWPIGTNLFTADEARAMLEHVLKRK